MESSSNKISEFGKRNNKLGGKTAFILFLNES